MAKYMCVLTVLFAGVIITGCGGTPAAKTGPAEASGPALTPVTAPAPVPSAIPAPAPAAAPVPAPAAAEFSKAKGDEIPAISIPMPGSLITVDGELNEAAWNTAAMMELVDIWATANAKVYKTLVKTLADKQGLYAAFICSEDHMADLKTAYTDRDSEVWNDDEVEIFFYAGHEDAETYYHILVNAAGTVADEYNRDMAAWDCKDLKAAVRKLDNRWVLELMMPWSGLLSSDGPLPSKWRMNFTRTRQGKGGTSNEDQCWSPILTESNHVPERFGFVTIGALEGSE